MDKIMTFVTWLWLPIAFVIYHELYRQPEFKSDFGKLMFVVIISAIMIAAVGVCLLESIYMIGAMLNHWCSCFIHAGYC